MEKFTMVVCVVVAMTFSAGVVWGDQLYTKAVDFYSSNVGQSMTKLEAVRLLVNDKNATVMKCYPVELNDKVTLVKKRLH